MRLGGKAAMSINWVVLVLALAASSAVTTPATRVPADGVFNLRIVHTNDMHARFEQISQLGGKCTEYDIQNNRCYGGFPRLLTAVKQQRQKAAQDDVPILFLNAGDTYQGTAWYTVHKWQVVSNLTNYLGIDAMSLGNHEFDDGVAGLVPFLQRTNCPVVTCNLGLEGEPDLARADRLKPSHVFELDAGAGKSRKVGVVGYLTPETSALSQTGNVKIYNEIDEVKDEAQKLKSDGVDIIIAVGHSGFDMDLKIAEHVPDVDVVIGGHTNTFLYTGTQPDSETPTNLYPVIVTQASQRKVAVVQAYAYTKYLGVLNLAFDSNGEVTSASGNPQLLNYEVAEDPDMLKALEPWQKKVDELTKRTLGKTKVLLDAFCRFSECNLGNLITDAFINYGVANHAQSGWALAPIAIQQGGGIRASIEASRKNGIVTMEDMIITMPFSNTVEIVSLKGKYLLEALEWSVTRYDPTRNIGRGEFLQYSGIRVVYNLAKPPGSRVVEAFARCGDCPVPKFEPIKSENTYNVLMPSFLARGGDNFTVFQKHGRQLAMFDKTDTDIVAEYIEDRKMVYPDVQGRISIIIDDGYNNNSGHRVGYSPLVALLLSSITFRFR